MRKLYITLIVVFSLFGMGKMQAQRFNAGLTVGPTFSQVDGDRYAGFHQVGLTAGAYVNLPFGDYLSGQMELKYSILGAHSSHKEVTEYNYPSYSLRLHYVEIPLMIRYNLGALRLNFLTLEAGVGLDLRMRATEDVDGDFEVTTRRWNFFSATANVGVHFTFSKHFGAGVRFMYSVVPCRFTGNPGWFYNQYYNKVFQFTLTYNINSPLR